MLANVSVFCFPGTGSVEERKHVSGNDVHACFHIMEIHLNNFVRNKSKNDKSMP